MCCCWRPAAGLQAATQAGYPRAADISGGLEEGFGWCDLNIVDSSRQSARDAYLTPALDRPNLDVVTSALVHRVRLEGHRCTGVDYSVGTDAFSVYCSGEVVLTAGTVGTDGQAVVDTELRVRGISGLRVADASVMPSAPSGNTNATVYAIAERAAHLIHGHLNRPI